jgi:Zn-dependent protease with chaperone function
MLPSNFFELQERAKTRTSYLIFLFLIALIATVACVTAIILGAVAAKYPKLSQDLLHNPDYYLGVAGTVSLFVGLASLFKIISLKATGGRGVLSGYPHRIIKDAPTNDKDRMLKNVVEEMSIASGFPIPTIAVIEDESAINAFAAGFQAQDSVVAVTQGALDQLNRDQLQGVIAHEFSHLLNKDTSINLKIMGAIHGLLILSIIGRGMMRIRSSSSSSNRDSGGGILVLVGLGLFLCGLLGKLFSSIIQAAVSRQREFLADASAVQFTRNPLGIGGALRKIMGATSNRLNAPKAAEMSHFFFFSNPSSLFATHPPLQERIAAIAPQLLKEKPQDSEPEESPPRKSAGPSLQSTSLPKNPLGMAAMAISQLPTFEEKENSPSNLPSVIAALFFSNDKTIFNLQREMVAATYSDEIAQEGTNFAKNLAYADLKTRYLTLERLLSKIRASTPQENKKLVNLVRTLILLDKKVSYFEMIIWICMVDAATKRQAYQKVRAKVPSENFQEATLLLKLVADTSNQSGVAANQALHTALKIYWPEGPGYVAPLKNHNLDSLPLKFIGEALEELKFSAESVRRKFMEAALNLATSNALIEEKEWVLLRALGILLECPVPLPS